MVTPIQQNGKDTLMKIEISYGFQTDGDYSLKTPKKFGCIGENEHFDFIGTKTFTNNETWRCKLEAKTFLEQLLCDGIHISHTHYWLMEDFYDIIDSLIDYINQNDFGTSTRILSGNYSPTTIAVEIFQ